MFGTPCHLRDTSNIKQQETKKQFGQTSMRGREFGQTSVRGRGYRPNTWEVQDPNTFATDEVTMFIIRVNY